MHLEELSVFNFRNLKNSSYKFKNTITLFSGNNAQGKTNLLEAIYLLSSGKSFRTRIDHQLISWGGEQAKITGKADNLEIELIIKPDSKELTINKQSKKLTELIGSFIVVVFTPNDIEIISGGPEKKRRFLDRLASSVDKQYLYHLINFNKILKSRNQILYNIKIGKNEDLWVWDKQLADSASFLWVARNSLTRDLNEILATLAKKIIRNDLKIIYQNEIIGESRKEIEKAYLRKLEASRNYDIARSLTAAGPHRDDFRSVTEERENNKIISKDLGVYGSRGEQRAAALALKLSEIKIIEEKRNIKPVLLLDEVFGELDREHQELLLHQLKKQQTFITSTSTSPIENLLGSSFEKYEVSNGIAKKV